MRRHLNTAQRSEIGLILLKEEEERAKERKQKINVEIGKSIGKGQGKSELLTESQTDNLVKKIDKIKEENKKTVLYYYFKGNICFLLNLTQI